MILKITLYSLGKSHTSDLSRKKYSRGQCYGIVNKAAGHAGIPLWVLVHIPATLLPNQLPANEPGKAEGDPCTQSGGFGRSSWFWPVSSPLSVTLDYEKSKSFSKKETIAVYYETMNKSVKTILR